MKVREREQPTKVDGTDGTVIYEGFYNGNATIPRYAIRKKTLDGTTWRIEWSGGSQEKSFEWSQRTSLQYSEIIGHENYQG